ncbi:uncharacterized protein LOC121869616 isoform X2 [Homarus americanus]|uniref:uncharacterized protein LOC121869616 isoform X2 n=1 Tax=Homarus americanus TaxID=6706 RepID=UPI001C476808|nr:uncharacterized protein LOC121869616 isoform X2 [Homarus americanus]
MKLLVYYSLALMVVVNAAPSQPMTVKVVDREENVSSAKTPRHTWFINTHRSDTLPGTGGDQDETGVEVDRDDNTSLASIDSAEDKVTSDESSVLTDLCQMEKDLYLIHLLLGHSSNPNTNRCASFGTRVHFDMSDNEPKDDYFDYHDYNYDNNGGSGSGMFGFPGFDFDSSKFPGYSTFDIERKDDSFDYYDYDNNGGSGSGMFGFPGFDFDSSKLPGYPSWLPESPSIPKVDDLPDNYDNSTHDVHLVNGTRVEVNTTTNKKSGDGFTSFYHHQFINIRPDQVPDDEDKETPQVKEDTDEEETVGEEEGVGEEKVPVYDEELLVIPQVENEVSSSDFPAHIPNLNEVSSSDFPTLNEVVPTEHVATDEGLVGGGGGVKLLRSRRSLNTIHFPQPAKPAAYVDQDTEEVDVDEGHHPKPDLSSDTLVNHVNRDHQGLSKVDPDAEIFNLTLVLNEGKLKDNDDDK